MTVEQEGGASPRRRRVAPATATGSASQAPAPSRQERAGGARRGAHVAGTIGNRLLAAILRDGASTALMSVQEQWLEEGELRPYQFMVNHYRRYSRLPSAEALVENGIGLPPPPPEPVNYYLERCEERAQYNILRALLPQLGEAAQAGQVSRAFQLMRGALSSANTAVRQRDLSLITDETGLFLRNYREDKFRCGLKGVTTGYAPVDEHTDGLQGGDVGVLVGRPNLGKTYLLLHMVVSAWLSGKSILFVSMEMSTKQIVQRIVAILASIDPYYIRRGLLSVHAEAHMMESIRNFADLPPFWLVAGKFRKTVQDIDGYVQEVMPDIIYIDGGYLIGSSRNQKNGSKHERLTEVIEDLKAMATDRDRPVMTTVQFNREVRKKTTKDMDLAQIAGTDAIGQIASLVMGIQLGPRSNRSRQRIVEMLKNREGELVKFITNFQFGPPDFRYLGTYVDEEVQLEEEGAAHDAELRASMV
ncbi:hypothetical protein H10PHJ05_73 [Aeromonas phage HJ05]|nr:hypothetical protein H10PHJ05_73 [Aeromonas phage HJ05]